MIAHEGNLCISESDLCDSCIHAFICQEHYHLLNALTNIGSDIKIEVKECEMYEHDK